MSDKYIELRIKINPEMEEILSEICFENLPCEGIVLAEETYKDLEMVSTTEGTLKIFLTDSCISSDDISVFLREQREILKSRGFSDKELGSFEFELFVKENHRHCRWFQKALAMLRK